jgi:hypothetical protein
MLKINSMPTLTEQQIKEIADQIQIGNRSFWHKKTNELLFVPDFLDNPYFDTDLFDEELENLENNFLDYVEIEKPNSSDSFEFMVNFTEQLDDNEKLKNQLIKSLNKKKPFREFKFVIDNSGAYRQQWFDYKEEQLRKWVIKKFDEATNFDI